MSTEELVGELDGAEVQYELVWHRKTSTAAEEAAALFVPREQVAKTLVLATRAGYVRAVVPASARIDLSKAGKVLGGDETTRLATEQELAEAFPMFELGAVPPFGGGPGDRTIVDVFEEILGIPFDPRWTKTVSIDVPIARRLAQAVSG